MDKTSSLLSKTLVIGVIILFCGISVQPCIAFVQKEITKTPAINQDETWYLANFTMDFGENITNNRIEYDETDGRLEGNWTINVKIKFRCPENLKIIVKYSYYAKVIDSEIFDEICFCDVDDTITIINGSNPPSIDIDYTQFCPNNNMHWWKLILRIEANLTAYEFIDGEWVKSHNDDIFNETIDWFVFNRIRTSERTHFLMRFFKRFPNMEVFLRIMNLLR